MFFFSRSIDRDATGAAADDDDDDDLEKKNIEDKR